MKIVRTGVDHAETTGAMKWWRRVDNISQRKNKPQPVLNESFLRGLNKVFAKLRQYDSCTEPSLQEIDREKHLSPRLNETEIMLALSKIKKIASGRDNIPCRVWRDNALLLAPVVTFIGTYLCAPLDSLRHGKSLTSVTSPKWTRLRNTRTFVVLT